MGSNTALTLDIAQKSHFCALPNVYVEAGPLAWDMQVAITWNSEFLDVLSEYILRLLRSCQGTPTQGYDKFTNVWLKIFT